MIFCRPRHNYQPYTDLWTLVKLCGYELIYIDEIDIESDNCYIISSPDVNCFNQQNVKARVIFWLLEWYGDYQQRDGIAETWVCNKTFAHKVNARYVPMGSHAELGTRRTGDFYDLVHLSYDAIYRRGWLLGELRKKGVKIAPNGWGEERDLILRNSRMMVHIHQQAEYPAIAPLRASIAGAYALPLIVENGWSTEPYTQSVVPYAYDELQLGIMSMVDIAQGNIQYYGDQLHHLLCEEYRFDKVVEANI